MAGASSEKWGVVNENGKKHKYTVVALPSINPVSAPDAQRSEIKRPVRNKIFLEESTPL